MKLLFFVTFNIIIVGFYCFITERSTNFRDFNLFVTDEKTNADNDNMKCPLACGNGLNSRIMVQTAAFNLTNINAPIELNQMAIVYYRCGKVYPNVGSPTEMQYNSFQRLCDNRTENCREYASSYESNWNSINTNKKRIMNVNLQMPDDINELRIKTKICLEDSIIFSFMIDDKSIDYNSDSTYKYDGKVFSTTKLNKSPIKLSITKYPNESIVDIIFNVTRSKCASGWHEISDTGYKCFLTIDDRRIDGGYKSLYCQGGGQNKQKETNDVCKYYTSRGKTVCKEVCYNMPDCSYLCATNSAGNLKEGGYIMGSDPVKYPDVIGSGRWTPHGLPLNMVLFNECQSASELCQLGQQYCRDKDISFSCTNGSYNLDNCLTSKEKFPYFRCPADETALLMIVQTPLLLQSPNNSMYYMNEIVTFLDNKTNSISSVDVIWDLFRMLSVKTSNKSFILPLKEKRSFASFLLRAYVDRYMESSDNVDSTVNNDQSIYAYKTVIDNDKDEVDLIMSPGSNENDVQFVKLELKPGIARSNQNLTASFIQYKHFDVMNESGAIESNLQNMTSIIDIKITPDDYPVVEDEDILYKNSDMFSLKVNDNNAFKAVKFKLPVIQKMISYSWAYEVKEVCGYLVENESWTWSTAGCNTVQNGTDYYCECNHLSNFAMLGSMREVNKGHMFALRILSVVGGVINMVSFVLFLIFVLFINSREKLRIDQLNIAICLLLGTIIFLCGYWFSSNLVLCAISALTSQFLFLAAFVWKLILGINVVRLIASLRYQNEDWMVKYKWIMLGTGYSIPLIIVIISGCLYWDYYGPVADGVCWINASSRAFLTFLIPISIIIALNIIGLFFIANTLIRNYINTRKTRMNESNELVVFIQLLISMGFTWTPLYFAIAYLPAMYLFVIFFPLQGLLMFLLVVVVNKENREKVSSFFINSYHSMTSKSTSGSEAKNNSKSKSTAQSKVATEESDNLLSGTYKTRDGRDRSEDRLLATDSERPSNNLMTKC